MAIPNNKQITNCSYMGWEYLGDGLFAKGGMMGYFTEENGWYVE